VAVHDHDVSVLEQFQTDPWAKGIVIGEIRLDDKQLNGGDAERSCG